MLQSSVTSSGCVAELSKYIGDEKSVVWFEVVLQGRRDCWGHGSGSF